MKQNATYEQCLAQLQEGDREIVDRLGLQPQIISNKQYFAPKVVVDACVGVIGMANENIAVLQAKYDALLAEKNQLAQQHLAALNKTIGDHVKTILLEQAQFCQKMATDNLLD